MDENLFCFAMLLLDIYENIGISSLQKCYLLFF